jgi:hypothetical protein
MAKNIGLTVTGIVLLLAGIVLVLKPDYWQCVVIVFKGFVGPTLAVIGLFLLFLVSGKSSKT